MIMTKFGVTEGLRDPDEDIIVIHLGHLSEERYKAVADSVIAFMNKRWPDVKNVGINN